jgi:hypothetical protein
MLEKIEMCSAICFQIKTSNHSKVSKLSKSLQINSHYKDKMEVLTIFNDLSRI